MKRRNTMTKRVTINSDYKLNLFPGDNRTNRIYHLVCMLNERKDELELFSYPGLTIYTHFQAQDQSCKMRPEICAVCRTQVKKLLEICWKDTRKKKYGSSGMSPCWMTAYFQHTMSDRMRKPKFCHILFINHTSLLLGSFSQ